MLFGFDRRCSILLIIYLFDKTNEFGVRLRDVNMSLYLEDVITWRSKWAKQLCWWVYVFFDQGSLNLPGNKMVGDLGKNHELHLRWLYCHYQGESTLVIWCI